jgi:glycosyltransferase involved in cell wall biosynthesis
MSNVPTCALSVIIPVTDRYDDTRDLFYRYKAAVEAWTTDYEFIYVLDGENPPVASALRSLQQRGERIRTLALNRWFGEATALALGFEEASADTLLTLPAYEQVEAPDIPKVLAALDDCDLVVARRAPRRDSRFNQLQSTTFHRMVKMAAGFSFNDLGCGVRALRRDVIEDVAVYGDLHRFLPMLASRKGFKVVEVDVRQASKDKALRIYGAGVYVRRLLDIMSTAFMLRFVRKPFRFFGLIGFSVFLIGALITAVLVLQRLFFGMPLGDRPALVISSLIVVLGIQIFAIGLIAEVIIFTQGRKLKEYRVERIVAFPSPREPAPEPVPPAETAARIGPLNAPLSDA